MNTIKLLVVLSMTLMAGACESANRASGPGDNGAIAAPEPRLFEGLGDHTRATSQQRLEAQPWFDQGLTWAFAFNHDEAIRSFTKAAEIDPGFALAYWGIALCHGPHINNPAMSEERSRLAWEALQQALARKGGASPDEQQLIDALSHRYAWPAPHDRAPLDKAYADAMRTVWHAHPKDADIGTLFAEAMMDLRPWDLWLPRGQPQPGTEEIVQTLEAVLALDPSHPGANHLYIHAMEASPWPDKAVAAADRLRTLVPAAGHLVHMPAHIDVRVGDWSAAADSNVQAIAADKTYRTLVPQQGFYRLYMAHNYHFLAWAAMMEGRREVALQAARDMLAGVPPSALETMAATLDPVMAIEYDVMKRFGMWDTLLALPAPDRRLPITTALWRMNRGVACAAKGDVGGARREQALFRQAVAAVPAGAMMQINAAEVILKIGGLLLDGEIALREGRLDDSIRLLREGVEIEDTLRYMEPPDWIQPVRHTLGAVLVKAGRFAEAELVYHEDLKRWPGNGWSLLGLSQCMRALGQSGSPEFAGVESRLQRAWRRADTRPDTSCMCVRKSGDS